jgi:hypothetical protein
MKPIMYQTASIIFTLVILSSNSGAVSLNQELSAAAVEGDKEEVTRLLKLVDVNGLDDDGFTALMKVASSGGGGSGMFDFLLQNGANPDIKSRDGMTVLGARIILGDFEGVELILKAGGNVNITDRYGRTALFREMERHGTYIGTVLMLLSAGADPSLQATSGVSKGKAALDVAKPPAKEILEAFMVSPVEMKRILNVALSLKAGTPLPRDLRKLVSQRAIQDIVDEKLKKIDDILSHSGRNSYDKKKLRSAITQNIIKTVKKQSTVNNHLE